MTARPSLQDESGAKDPSVLAGVLAAPPPDPRYTAPSTMSFVKAKMFGVKVRRCKLNFIETQAANT
jgi:hypothetical protein